MLYIFGIVMHMILKEDMSSNPDEFLQERFQRLLMVMFTLLIDGTFMDSPGIVMRRFLERGDYLAWIVMMSFLMNFSSVRRSFHGWVTSRGRIRCVRAGVCGGLSSRKPGAVMKSGRGLGGNLPVLGLDVELLNCLHRVGEIRKADIGRHAG